MIEPAVVSSAFEWGAATHTGRVRSVNQDAVLAGPAVFAVADGMGGHAAGDVASSLAVATLARVVGEADYAEADGILAAVHDANRRILAEVTGTDGVGMGTTLALIAGCGGDRLEELLIVNVGDSRVYRFSDVAGLEQVSADHSVVADLVADGSITLDEAATHPERNAITRALGIDETVEPDLWRRPPVVGDRYLVCSDGLVREISDEEIGEELASNRAPSHVAERLLDAALQRGAKDNVSVVVVEIVAGAQRIADSTGESTRPAAGEDTVPRSGRSAP